MKKYMLVWMIKSRPPNISVGRDLLIDDFFPVTWYCYSQATFFGEISKGLEKDQTEFLHNMMIDDFRILLQIRNIRKL